MSINGGDDNFQFYGSGSYLRSDCRKEARSILSPTGAVMDMVILPSTGIPTIIMFISILMARMGALTF